MATFLVADDCILVVINVHIPPQWNHSMQQDMLSRTRAMIPSQYAAITFICGDLNFDHDYVNGRAAPNRKPVAKWLADTFYKTFHDFTEFSHSEATHIGRASVSQLDHIMSKIGFANGFVLRSLPGGGVIQV